MPVHIRCQCGKEFTVPDERAHKPFKCYICRADVVAAPTVGQGRVAGQTSQSVTTQPGLGDSSTLAQSTEAPVVSKEWLAAKARAAYQFAAEQLAAGVANEQIEAKLVEQGHDPERAKQIVEETITARTTALREAGQRNLISGILLCVGGVGFSVVSYTLFAALGSSRFLIASGAVVVGVFQLIRGLVQLSNGQEDYRR